LRGEGIHLAIDGEAAGIIAVDDLIKPTTSRRLLPTACATSGKNLLFASRAKRASTAPAQFCTTFPSYRNLVLTDLRSVPTLS
jgi:hypothetical protein